MSLNIGLYEDEIENRNGQGLPLAFVYDDVPYYFSPDVWTDDASSGYRPRGRDAVLGREANEALRSAIADYGSNGGQVWIAPWFRGHVSAFLADEKGGSR